MAEAPEGRREATERRPVRLAITADLHARLDRPGRLRRSFLPVNEEADLLVIAGDLTDRGHPEEAQLLVEELSVVRVPKVAVLGNHDHEQGKAEEVAHILARGGIRLLDGDVFVFEERLGVAGTKGFCGGFGRATLEPWGEEITKRFVYEAVNESLKLETALARLGGFDKRVAVTHYAPTRSTVEGENPELVAFLGCSRLAEPIDKFLATLAVHGHAHHGQVNGRTPRGVPVYNATMDLLDERMGRRFLVIEV